MASAANSASSHGAVRIRQAESKDAEALTRVINAAFVVEQAVFDGDRVDLAGVHEYMRKGTFLVAEDAAELIGCVYVQLLGERAYLGLLSVEPSRQGRGFGQRLLAAAEDFARRTGVLVMDLRVISARAELVPFYHQAGYRQTGTAPFAPDVTSKIPAHYLLMSKQIR